MALVVAGALTGLLTLAGAELLELPATTVAEAFDGCQVFTVRGDPGDSTHIRIENPRAETIRVHLALIAAPDDWPSADQSLVVAPWSGTDVQVSAPTDGGVIQLRSSVRNLHTTTEVHHLSGAAAEPRFAYLCLDTFS